MICALSDSDQHESGAEEARSRSSEKTQQSHSDHSEAQSVRASSALLSQESCRESISAVSDHIQADLSELCQQHDNGTEELIQC